ncbi:unnamed protein product [Larinioides sclopetarius]|uniref:Glycine zipper 2TM domain-containing protein n=1 Tax=Larinioides sclopetarius TaxID=280406 RepID=A0AAV1ZRN3_9ARAC
MTLLRQTFYEVMTIATLMAFFTPCKASEPQVAMDLLTGGIGGILGNRGDGVGEIVGKTVGQSVGKSVGGFVGQMADKSVSKMTGGEKDFFGGQKQEDGIWINQWVDGFLGENGLIGGQDRGQERVESIGGFLGR